MDWGALTFRRLVVFLTVATSVSVNGMTQERLDYMAKHLQVKYEVVNNLRDDMDSYKCQFTLNNTGRRTFPGRGWAIYFTQLALVEPYQHPYPNGVIKPGQNVLFRHIQGSLFSVEPVGGFLDIPSGGTRVIEYIAENGSVSRTDSFPNWYLWAPGLEPRTLVNTAGEELKWVGDFDTENKWKRFDFIMPDEEAHDRYDPYTAGARYSVNEVEDLGGPKRYVIPTPVDIKVSENNYVQLNTKDWAVFTGQKFINEGKMLAERLGISLAKGRPESRVIIFKTHDLWWNVKGKEVGGAEAYTLIVDPIRDVIEIKAHDPPGAFYGAMSLLNMMDDDYRVPETRIVDTPRYEYRGLLLDVARNFQPVEQVLKVLDLMAQYKLNKFHFHLTDDEGWRIQIPGLEELTEVAGRRCHDLQEKECLLPFLGSGPTPSVPASGFYTVEDYKEILRYAAQRHIQVIPEVDMPGHGHAAIKAMAARRQRLRHTDNRTEASKYLLVDDDDTSWYKSIQLYTDNAVNPCMDSTYNFVSHVVGAFVEAHRDIMPLQLFHFGGDEVAPGAWENSTACNTLLSSGFDFRTYRDLKEYFVRKVSQITYDHGLDIGAWEDGLMESGSTPYTRNHLPNRKVYAYAWDNVWEWGVAHRAHKLANAGFKVVMAQATHMYFDHPYEPDPEERGLYWAPRFTHTRKTFSFMPSNLYANADFMRSGDPVEYEMLCGHDGEDCVELNKPENIAGIQGHLWSEMIRNKQQADYMLFPRFFALAERAWHKPSWELPSIDNKTRMQRLEHDWAAFANTLGYRELARLDRQGVEYRVPPPGAIMTEGRLETNVAFPGLQVEYSIDDGATWCAVSGPVPYIYGSPVLLRTKSASGGRYSRVISVRTDNVNSSDKTHGAMSILSLLFAVFMSFVLMDTSLV